jgi:hypothetical protein
MTNLERIDLDSQAQLQVAHYSGTNSKSARADDIYLIRSDKFIIEARFISNSNYEAHTLYDLYKKQYGSTIINHEARIVFTHTPHSFSTYSEYKVEDQDNPDRVVLKSNSKTKFDLTLSKDLPNVHYLGLFFPEIDRLPIVIHQTNVKLTLLDVVNDDDKKIEILDRVIAKYDDYEKIEILDRVIAKYDDYEKMDQRGLRKFVEENLPIDYDDLYSQAKDIVNSYNR